MSVLFSTKWHLFRDFIIFCSRNIFFIQHVLKFKYPAGRIKVNPLLLLKTLFRFWGGSLFLHYIKCGHKIEVGRAEFLNMFFASVHLSVVLRYIYCI